MVKIVYRIKFDLIVIGLFRSLDIDLMPIVSLKKNINYTTKNSMNN